LVLRSLWAVIRYMIRLYDPLNAPAKRCVPLCYSHSENELESSSRRGMANCQRIPVLYLEIYSTMGVLWIRPQAMARALCWPRPGPHNQIARVTWDRHEFGPFVLVRMMQP